MTGDLRTGRQTRSLPSDRRAVRSTGREYDDNGLRVAEPLEQILPGQDLTRGWADIDDDDRSDMERAVAPADADFSGDDVSVPIIGKRANEFTCSRCFLIQHVNRLAASGRGQLICIDCA